MRCLTWFSLFVLHDYRDIDYLRFEVTDTHESCSETVTMPYGVLNSLASFAEASCEHHPALFATELNAKTRTRHASHLEFWILVFNGKHLDRASSPFPPSARRAHENVIYTVVFGPYSAHSSFEHVPPAAVGESVRPRLKTEHTSKLAGPTGCSTGAG